MEDDGDRERRLALAAAKAWLPGKPPEVWNWVERAQQGDHDENGILEWMHSQSEYKVKSSTPAESCVSADLPMEYRHHRDPLAWDFFNAMYWADCPRPGSEAFEFWRRNPPDRARARRLFPDLFPQTLGEKLMRSFLGAALVAFLVLCMYACIQQRLK